MKRQPILLALGILALAVINFFYFPGHTWLQSDTQIYTAILEHLWDPSALTHDLVATRPHVSFTIYDETAIALRKLTGLGFREVLGGEQFVFRLLALWGVCLIAVAMGLSRVQAFFVTSAFALGAVINGPAVLLFEYEPVPRGFAVALIFFSVGLAAHRNWLGAGCAGALAFLFHPPTAIALWAVAGALWLVSHRNREPSRILIPAAVAVAALFALSRMQAGEREAQQFFGRIDPALEQLQRMRGAYNWIELWPAEWFWQYPLLFGIVLLAWWQLRHSMTVPLRWLTLGLPVCGVLSVPATWLLLDVAKWNFIPQFQPARAVLFITAFAMILGTAAGLRARGAEAAAWFFAVYALPANGRLMQLFELGDPLMRRRMLVVAGLAIAVMLVSRQERWLAVAAFVPFFAIPPLAAMRNSPDLHTPEVKALSAWAREHTPKESIFLFAGFGRDLSPGIFRAEALRAQYVDWKGGGQVNLLPRFALDWWKRWQETGEGKFVPTGFGSLGIDYVVLPPTIPSLHPPVYQNTRYSVYEAVQLRP